MSEVIERLRVVGYLWKSILLPPGTKARITYMGITFWAVVEGNDFLCEGKKLTPSQFVNAYAGGRRELLWIKRPRDRDFGRADDLATTAGEQDPWATIAPEQGCGGS
jgi:hypothetical protein